VNFRRHFVLSVLALIALPTFAAGIVTMSGPKLFVEGGAPPPADETPDQFTFTDEGSVALSTERTHAALTVAGLGTGVSGTFTASGCTIDKNGSGFASSQSLENDDTFRARMTSSGSYGTAVNCTVTSDSVSDTWTVATEASPDSPLTVALNVSRTSGPAPLGVRANALGSTHTDGSIATWRQVGYAFHSGDETMGNNPIFPTPGSGYARWFIAGGPQATFVYETAGTYTMKVRGYHPATGGDDQDEVTITVTSADSYYPGTNTICLSRNTDHTGCPSGATQSSNVSSWPTWTSSRRYLLRAGQDFGSLGSINLNYISNIQVGKFGSGAKPIVDGVAIMGMNPTGGGTSWPTSITIMDLQTYVYTGITADHVLILRCDAPTTAGIGFGLDLNSSHYAFNTSIDVGIRNAIRASYSTILYEVTQGGGSSINYNVFGAAGDNAAVVGSDLGSDSADIFQHNIRFGNSNNLHISRNRLRRVSPIRLHIKLHASGVNTPYNPVWTTWGPNPGDGGAASEYAVVQQNLIGNAGYESHPWGMQLTPQNDSSAEWNRRFIVEDQVFMWNFDIDMVFGGEGFSWRGNSGTGVNVATGTGMNAIPLLSGDYNDDGGSIPWLAPQ
jgi:hypothetical protein